jgi:RNase adapter protein RapZ
MQDRDSIRLLIITGLSGAGKTSALHALEDTGYFCIDNLPVLLLNGLLDLIEGSEAEFGRLAVGMDIRAGRFLDQHEKVFQQVRNRGIRPEILFLEASTESLVRRFKQTGRPHPLARDRALLDGIEEERGNLSMLKHLADRIIDTSKFNVHQMRQYFNRGYGRIAKDAKKLQVELFSFGYSQGIPLQGDLILDVRFLPNPYYDPDLRDRDGRDPVVQEAIQSDAKSTEMLCQCFRWLEAMIDFYENEDRAYFQVGFGCTGGKHRSVAVVSILDKRLRDRGYHPFVLHRELPGGT